MAITLVELQGSIPRQQDFQQLRQMEAQKVLADQANSQTQVEKNTEQNARQVNQQENAIFDKDDHGQGKGSYQGDGGRNRPGKQKEDKIVEKSKGSFDIRI
ncbi:MAG: hypothetical protein IJZ00_07260 [Lachnospiraceae bacterium]|nr:hypothetical protein [Lachnospiraceae bacterium]